VLPLPLTVGQRRLAAVALLGALVLVLVLRHAGGSGDAGSPPLQVDPVAAATPRAGAGAVRPVVVVDVVGAVLRPGVYRLAQGERVADAVARAGGLTRRAERTAINMAAPLVDGEQVVVAARRSGTPGGVGGAVGSTSAPVSLSAATAEQLDALPGVGPVTAQKIIAYRQQHGAFTSVDELDAIPGIGPARIADLQGLVVP